MRFNSFALSTRWLVAASIEEIAAILAAPERLTAWWPAVYLAAEVVDAGDVDGLGRTAAFNTRGWLPYTLRWRGKVASNRLPHELTIEASGDLAGRGIWRLEQRRDLAAVTYDWEVRIEKPGLRLLSPLLRPVFAANHRWAMERGFQGLNTELIRNRAALLTDLPPFVEGRLVSVGC